MSSRRSRISFEPVLADFFAGGSGRPIRLAVIIATQIIRVRILMSSRFRALFATAACAGATLLYSRFRADLPMWWRSFGGGIPYVAFWCCFGFLLVPKRSWILRICLFATFMTCMLEFLQLWNPPPLAAFRATRFGAALLGSTFVWADFPPYFVGGIIGYGLLKLLYPRNSESSGG